MIQLWVLPERPGEPAGYLFYQPGPGGLTRVYGGAIGQKETFHSHTLVDIGLLETGQTASVRGSYLAYLTRGAGLVNGTPVKDGDLVRGEDLAFSATENSRLIIVHLAP